MQQSKPHTRVTPVDLRTAFPTGWRARALLTGKIALTLGILVALLGQADWNRLFDRMAHASPELLALGFAIKTLTIPFAAERWRMIGRVVGMHLSSGLSLRLVMAALFFGQVLPGALGGDAVRGWLTWRSGQPPGTVVAALLLDRLAALAGLGLLILLGLPRLLSMVPPGVAGGVLAAMALAGLSVLVLLLLARLDRIPGWLPVPASLSVHVRAVAAGLRGALVCRAAPGVLAHSVAVHLSTIVATVVFAHALSVPVRPLDALAVMPLAIAAMALPISLAGWGVREGSMVTGFALFGIAGDDSLLVALLVGLSVTLLAVPGGIAWLSLPGRARTG